MSTASQTNNHDLENAGVPQLKKKLIESTPELRWYFIRKVYGIIFSQLLLTIAIVVIIVNVKPINKFFAIHSNSLPLRIVLIVTPFIILCPMFYFRQKHPVNFVLLTIFTVSVAVLVGITCVYTEGKVIYESMILTTVVVVSLSVYSFWAVKRGQDFTFLGPFLFASLMVLIVFGLIQIFWPLGKVWAMVYGSLASIIFCAYIVYDTSKLIKRHTYQEYVWASISIYLDIVNLFLSILTLGAVSASS
ncbi:hypothetical protein ACFE04_015411 [Oxalis oulophora]